MKHGNGLKKTGSETQSRKVVFLLQKDCKGIQIGNEYSLQHRFRYPQLLLRPDFNGF